MIKRLRAIIAYHLVDLAMRVYPPLKDELVDMVIHPLLNDGEPMPMSKRNPANG